MKMEDGVSAIDNVNPFMLVYGSPLCNYYILHNAYFT